MNFSFSPGAGLIVVAIAVAAICVFVASWFVALIVLAGFTLVWIVLVVLVLGIKNLIGGGLDEIGDHIELNRNINRKVDDALWNLTRLRHNPVKLTENYYQAALQNSQSEGLVRPGQSRLQPWIFVTVSHRPMVIYTQDGFWTAEDFIRNDRHGFPVRNGYRLVRKLTTEQAIELVGINTELIIEESGRQLDTLRRDREAKIKYRYSDVPVFRP